MGHSSSSTTYVHTVRYYNPPQIPKTPQRVQLKNEAEMTSIFWSSNQYFSERMQHLSQLFNQYDNKQQQSYTINSQQKQKIALIIFGKSQTGKSSLINHLLQTYKCSVSQYGTGKSCTTEAECYGPTISRSNQNLLLIDTRGFDDYDPQVMNFETGQTLVQKIISDFMVQIQAFQPDSINFLITESLEGSTLQFKQNIQLILNLFGKNALQSAIIVLTKYNEHRFKFDEMLQEQTEQRIKSFEEQISKICNEYQLNSIPYQKFHTHVYDPQTCYIKEQISNNDSLYLQQQEQELFAKIENLPSYPIQIINQYNQYCKDRISQLLNTEGIGFQTIYV